MLVTVEVFAGLWHDSLVMAVKKPKTKARKTILKRQPESTTNAKQPGDLNDVAARLMQQSERNVVNQAAAHLLRKSS
jgi:hypothetical protein